MNFFGQRARAERRTSLGGDGVFGNGDEVFSGEDRFSSCDTKDSSSFSSRESGSFVWMDESIDGGFSGRGDDGDSSSFSSREPGSCVWMGGSVDNGFFQYEQKFKKDR